jgi:RsiW-degrading membrane proteinase PrsW (M82 family)
LLAVVIASFGLPLSSLGIIIAKMTKNRKLAFFLPVIAIIVVALMSMVFLRWQYPENPWF